MDNNGSDNTSEIPQNPGEAETPGTNSDEVIDTPEKAPDAPGEVPDTSNNKDSCIGIDGETEPDEMAEYYRVAAKPGKWIQASDGRWWYKHNDGTYTKNGWEYISGKWYYFNPGGSMKIGWLQYATKWYYLKSNGAMATGWQKISYNGKNEWFYFYSSGVMNDHNMTDNISDSKRTMLFLSNGVWLYTESLISWDLVDSGKHLDWGGSSMGVTSNRGTLKLNKFKLDNVSSNLIQNIVTHEFGHALGLGHNDSADVMYAYDSSVVNLTKNDKKSYDAAYKRY